MDFLVALVLGFTNGSRAAAKGYNRALWIFLSVLAFVVLESFAGALMLMVLYRAQLRADPLRMMEIAKDFSQNMDWTRSLLLLAIGFGGYLLIRYILERMPDNQAQGGRGPQA